MVVDTLVRGGTIVTPCGTFEADLAIVDGTIAAIGDAETFPSAETEIDATDRLVMPGIVDPHVHIDDMYSIDTYESATAAAALGGVTTVIDFAWQAWDGETSIWDGESTLQEGVERKKKKARGAYVDFGLHGGITRTDPAVFEELDALIDRGIPSFKMFTAYEIGLPNGFMNRVFEELAARDAVAALHTEDADVCEDITLRYQQEEKGDAQWYPSSRPDYAEAMAAEDAVRMATEAGCKYYGIHTSCKKSADVLAAFQREHGPELVRAETCTHYTLHDDSIYEELGTLPMIAPPIREPGDIEAIFDRLAEGMLEVVSTDHCAFTRESKQVDDWWDSSFGTNSLQVSLPVFHDEAVNRRDFSYPFLVQVMSHTPARLFGCPNKGSLEPGTDADLIVFDPNETWTIDASENASRADYSIYDDRTVTGRVEKTLVRGTVVADDGEIVSEPGQGRFIEREIPDWSAV